MEGVPPSLIHPRSHLERKGVCAPLPSPSQLVAGDKTGWIRAPSTSNHSGVRILSFCMSHGGFCGWILPWGMWGANSWSPTALVSSTDQEVPVNPVLVPVFKALSEPVASQGVYYKAMSGEV